MINQLESHSRNAANGYVQIKNAESIIRDVDYAVETANFNKYNIISQAGSFGAAQSNNLDKEHITYILNKTMS